MLKCSVNNRLLMLLWLIPIFLLYFHATDTFNQDLGRHLKLGEIIWNTHEVPKTNLFSYTNPDEPVLNSHWLSQVILYLVHRSAGVGGLILLTTIVNTLALGALFYFAARRVGWVVPGLAFIPFVFIFTDRSWIRPEMFGNLFYVVVLISLLSPRVRKIAKWMFPVIAMLWVNLHISWIFGIFAMGVVLLQDVLDSKIKNLKSNILLLLLTAGALLVNPYGWNGVMGALGVLNKYGYTIVENQSLWFLKDFGFPLVGHISLGLVALGFSYIFARRRPAVGEIIILSVITILTLRFVRNEVLFAYTAFLVVCFNISRFKNQELLKKYEIHITLASVLICSYLIMNANNGNGLKFGIDDIQSYGRGIDFYQSQNFEGPVLNDFDIGGYLIYRLYPQKIFIDNRPEAYPVEFFDIYKKMQDDPKILNAEAEKYGINTIIWSITDITPWSQKFMVTIVRDPNWKQVYLDKSMIILTKIK